MGQNVKILVPVQIMMETKLWSSNANLVDDHAMAVIIMKILIILTIVIILTMTVTIMNMTVTMTMMMMMMVADLMVTEQPGQ